MRSLIWIKLCRNFNGAGLKCEHFPGASMPNLICVNPGRRTGRKVEANLSAIHMTTVSQDLLQRFDIPGPRYTSYPTADRFVEAFTGVDLARALSHRRAGPAAAASPLSLYVHMPFCESLCYYCACNKIITKKHERGAAYLQALAREVELYTAQIGLDQPVTQLHLGGGSPTFLSDERTDAADHHAQAQLRAGAGRRAFDRDRPPHGGCAAARHLAALGFNRISFGIQDFDPEVQKAVHRVQPAEQVFQLMESARLCGFESINVDLIYGLPRQTPESFQRTLAQVAQLRPDRIALYGYAHLPERFKPQRRIHSAELPGGSAKLAMLSQALSAFSEAGYVYVGMDHFALPNDALAVAKRQGRLHRNFQGYSTQPDCDLIGLGVSAIGRIGATYSQNAKTLEEYCDLLDQGRLPVVRGLALSRDDLARRAVIMALMCQGQILFESIEVAWLLDFREYFAAEMRAVCANSRRWACCSSTKPASRSRARAGTSCARSRWCSTAICSPIEIARDSRASSETPGSDVDHARGCGDADGAGRRPPLRRHVRPRLRRGRTHGIAFRSPLAVAVSRGSRRGLFDCGRRGRASGPELRLAGRANRRAAPRGHSFISRCWRGASRCWFSPASPHGSARRGARSGCGCGPGPARAAVSSLRAHSGPSCLAGCCTRRCSSRR